MIIFYTPRKSLCQHNVNPVRDMSANHFSSEKFTKLHIQNTAKYLLFMCDLQKFAVSFARYIL